MLIGRRGFSSKISLLHTGFCPPSQILVTPLLMRFVFECYCLQDLVCLPFVSDVGVVCSQDSVMPLTNQLSDLQATLDELQMNNRTRFSLDKAPVSNR